MPYPSSLDNLTNPSSSDSLATGPHSTLHGDERDAIDALEAKLGINSSAVNTSVDYFLKHASGAYRTHTHDASSDDGPNIPEANVDFDTSAGHDHDGSDSKLIGVWADWTPTLAVSGGTAPTYTSAFVNRYCQIGKTVIASIYWLNMSGGTAGSGANILTFTLPVSAITANYQIIGSGAFFESGGTIGGVNIRLYNSVTQAEFMLNSTTIDCVGNDQSSALRSVSGFLTYEVA